jgi:anti-anti-sigma factor
MPTQSSVLRVYDTGARTIVGFGGGVTFDDSELLECRDELTQLVTQHDCETLEVDLSGVRYVPSPILGALTSVYKRGVHVHLFNPSTEVRELLRITRLDRLLHVHDAHK